MTHDRSSATVRAARFDRVPRILLVDDEPDICLNLRDILLDFGYEVDVAHEGESALELVARNVYDVALLDLKMPGMSGLELCERIKSVRADTVALIATAYANRDTVASALAAGAWKILAKPLEVPNLLALLEEAVDMPVVMLVDDDQELCATLYDVLRERGFRVHVAHELEAAERLLERQTFHVALIDMRLARGDGAQVFELVRRRCPASRAILITGFRTEMEERIRQAVQGGADAVCYKPFDIPHLLATIRSLASEADY